MWSQRVKRDLATGQQQSLFCFWYHFLTFGNKLLLMSKSRNSLSLYPFISSLTQICFWENICTLKYYILTSSGSSSLVTQMVKHLPTMWETQVWSLGWEDPLEKEMATHSSTLAWKIPWMEECCGLQYMGSQRVRHNWATFLHFWKYLHFKIYKDLKVYKILNCR